MSGAMSALEGEARLISASTAIPSTRFSRS